FIKGLVIRYDYYSYNSYYNYSDHYNYNPHCNYSDHYRYNYYYILAQLKGFVSDEEFAPQAEGMRPSTPVVETFSVILVTVLSIVGVEGSDETLTATQEYTSAINPVNHNEKRGDPVESRADFFGYFLRRDGTFSASFCYQGETVTTIGTLVGCCPPPGVSCSFGITCSRDYEVNTILGSPDTSKTKKWNCNGGLPGLYDCITTTLYQSEITSFPAVTKPPLVRVGCGMYIPGEPYPSYYLTLTPGAEATISTPPYPPGQPASTTTFYIPPITSSETTPISELEQTVSTPAAPETTTAGSNNRPGDSSNGDTSSPASSKSSSDNNDPSTTSKSGSISSGGPGEGRDGKPDSSESSASLSRSDQIAIGIGIGLGFPTVLIGVLTWFYPRHRLNIPGRQASTKSRLWTRSSGAAVTSAPPSHVWGHIGGGGAHVAETGPGVYALGVLPTTNTAPEIMASRVDLNNERGVGVR
ncbi:hypothetical protein V8F20_011271, partial [Naviculisporaceae sp. PSN 640]